VGAACSFELFLGQADNDVFYFFGKGVFRFSSPVLVGKKTDPLFVHSLL
jgi:hypothetical protein